MIKRYVAEGYDFEVREDVAGDYVTWDDYTTLRVERDALKADAERYRWLREQEAEKGLAVLSVGEWTAGATCIASTFPSVEDLDAAIDQAMERAK